MNRSLVAGTLLAGSFLAAWALGALSRAGAGGDPRPGPAIWATLLAVLILSLLWTRRVERTVRAPLDAVARAVRSAATESGIAVPDALERPPRRVPTDELVLAVSALLARLQEQIRDVEAESSTVRSILSGMLDAVIALDRDGRIVLFNPAAERLFETAKRDALGKPILKVVRNYELAQAFSRTLTTGEMRMEEFQLIRPTERILEARTSPMKTSKGKMVGVAGVLHDITELRHLEQVRSEFVANVSHEFRTPLTSIKGFLETLLDGAVYEPETAHRFLEIANREADRLTALVDDLLNLSRAESDETLVEHKPVDLARLIQACVDLMREGAARREIALALDAPESLPPVPGDETLLRQVFINLLDNAVKYTPAGGSVGVSIHTEEDALVTTVADTGIGIPESQQKRIYERFYRVDRARSRELGGTGLGLSIVRHALELHGGTISLESEEGVGTRFSVRLPTTEEGRDGEGVDRRR